MFHGDFLSISLAEVPDRNSVPGKNHVLPAPWWRQAKSSLALHSLRILVPYGEMSNEVDALSPDLTLRGRGAQAKFC
jgi:hypothetical protein